MHRALEEHEIHAVDRANEPDDKNVVVNVDTFDVVDHVHALDEVSMKVDRPPVPLRLGVPEGTERGHDNIIVDLEVGEGKARIVEREHKF